MGTDKPVSPKTQSPSQLLAASTVPGNTTLYPKAWYAQQLIFNHGSKQNYDDMAYYSSTSLLIKQQ